MINIETSLMAISPLDGRYHEKLDELRNIFSEYGLIRYRVVIEIRWLLMLVNHANLPEIARLSPHAQKILEDMMNHFSIKDANRIKHIESSTNHDVKACEYFIKEHIAGNAELAPLSEFIHFGLTSEDINNLAYGMMLQTARKQCLLPTLTSILVNLRKLAHDYAAFAMLSRTHGQPATPTTLGKEIANFIARLQRQIDQLTASFVMGKLNGASGNYNALAIAYPEIDWQNLSKNFVSKLELAWNPFTTQIEPHDAMAEFFATLSRINTILIDFCRDIWAYISINYFKQKAYAHEVGSSTMPHKINPIDFENAEGNLGISNALLSHMALKLPISRWQRDLSDSTVIRNMGVAIGHALLAYQAIEKGLHKLEPNSDVISHDLNQHWEVLAEAIQTIMRRYQLPQPYEQLKAFTRGKVINQEILHQFIKGLTLPEQIKKELLTLQPKDYIGYAEELAKRI